MQCIAKLWHALHNHIHKPKGMTEHVIENWSEQNYELNKRKWLKAWLELIYDTIVFKFTFMKVTLDAMFWRPFLTWCIVLKKSSFSAERITQSQLGHVFIYFVVVFFASQQLQNTGVMWSALSTVLTTHYKSSHNVAGFWGASTSLI